MAGDEHRRDGRDQEKRDDPRLGEGDEIGDQEWRLGGSAARRLGCWNRLMSRTIDQNNHAHPDQGSCQEVQCTERGRQQGKHHGRSYAELGERVSTSTAAITR